MLTPRSSLSVFVADDDCEMRRVLEEVLREEGFEVVTFSNGTDLWRAMVSRYSSGQPLPVVVSDVNMPDFTGFDIAAGARDAFLSVKFILFSAFSNEKMREAAKALGVQRLLRKPFTLDELKDAIGNASAAGRS